MAGQIWKIAHESEEEANLRANRTMFQEILILVEESKAFPENGRNLAYRALYRTASDRLLSTISLSSIDRSDRIIRVSLPPNKPHVP